MITQTNTLRLVERITAEVRQEIGEIVAKRNLTLRDKLLIDETVEAVVLSTLAKLIQYERLGMEA